MVKGRDPLNKRNKKMFELPTHNPPLTTINAPRIFVFNCQFNCILHNIVIWEIFTYKLFLLNKVLNIF